ncbi:meckelin [Lates japonicus]|uniref:Meckelin n=1 Tax=Lates japonicus TaxID=270547 RepID=A0AAD3MYN7_LATJO|nr:meckelin [Lates japonicus]
MATGTLPFVVNRHKVPLTLFLLIYVDLLHCQQFIISYKAPSECGVEEFFDISSLSCARCGPNQRRSTTGLGCVCKTGYQTLTTDKVSITCQQCPTDKPAVTKDGFGCIRCPGSLSDEGKCQCPPGNILVERDVSGNLLDEARCETCNGNSPALSVPNSNEDRCERCQASFIHTSCLCNPPNVLEGGLCFPPGTLSTNVNPSVNYAQLKFSVQSAWFVKNLYSSSSACLAFSNLTACQALGNMCVMNMHSFSGISNDACGLFNAIFRSRASASSTQDISYWFQLVPRTQEGQVFPPLMTVTYTDVPITDVKSQTVSTAFAVGIEMDQSGSSHKTDLLVSQNVTPLRPASGGTYFVANEWSEIQTIARSVNIQIMAVLFFLEVHLTPTHSLFSRKDRPSSLYQCCYYCLLRRTVSDVTLVVPRLKAIQFLHKLILQVSVDVFLIDWERTTKASAELCKHLEDLRPMNGTRSRPSKGTGHTPLMDDDANPLEQNVRAHYTMNHFLGSIIELLLLY